MTPVKQRNIDLATAYISNAALAAQACRAAGLPYSIAVPLLIKESKGRNVWGGDAGSVTQKLHGLPVTPGNFSAALIKIIGGGISNGVGPCQITYAGATVNGHRDGGYFREMLDLGLLPWNIYDNMEFGFTLMRKNIATTEGDLIAAGGRYNGGGNWATKPKAVQYGRDFAVLVQEFRSRFGVK